MLIHKGTMGVLDTYWTGGYRTGQDGVREPEMREYTLRDVPDPEGWWEVRRGSALGRKLRRVYPFCAPVTDGDGALVDVREPKCVQSFKQKPRQKQKQRRVGSGVLENILMERDGMFTMIELQEHENGGHGNQSSEAAWKGAIPDGWAVFPDGAEVENFPFFHVDSVGLVDGKLTVTAWHPLPIPEPEIEQEPEPTQLDRVEAQAAYTAMMTGTLLPEEEV